MDNAKEIAGVTAALDKVCALEARVRKATQDCQPLSNSLQRSSAAADKEQEALLVIGEQLELLEGKLREYWQISISPCASEDKIVVLSQLDTLRQELMQLAKDNYSHIVFATEALKDVLSFAEVGECLTPRTTPPSPVVKLSPGKRPVSATPLSRLQAASLSPERWRGPEAGVSPRIWCTEEDDAKSPSSPTEAWSSAQQQPPLPNNYSNLQPIAEHNKTQMSEKRITHEDAEPLPWRPAPSKMSSLSFLGDSMLYDDGLYDQAGYFDDGGHKDNIGIRESTLQRSDKAHGGKIVVASIHAAASPSPLQQPSDRPHVLELSRGNKPYWSAEDVDTRSDSGSCASAHTSHLGLIRCRGITQAECIQPAAPKCAARGVLRLVAAGIVLVCVVALRSRQRASSIAAVTGGPRHRRNAPPTGVMFPAHPPPNLQCLRG